MFDTTELVLNMGPQHPSTHGVLRVVLRLDGERVVGSDVVIGYLHRGIEKLCEHRDWAQIVFAHRPDGLRRRREQQPRLLRDRREAHVARGAARAPDTSGRSWPNCSGSRATACGWAPMRWTWAP